MAWFDDAWEDTVASYLRRRSTLILALFIGIVIGGALSWSGADSWDDGEQLHHTNWVLSFYGGITPRDFVVKQHEYYGPLWSMVLGLVHIPFRFLHDESFVRHTATWALFPLMLVVIMRLLLSAGVRAGTALLAGAMIFGTIRLGGHALFNIRDFPHAMAFTAVSLWAWTKLRAKLTGGTKFTLWDCFVFALLTLVPYLLRTPLLLHFAGSLLFLALYFTLVPSAYSTREKFKIWFAILFSGVVIIYSMFPILWTAGPRWWLESFSFLRTIDVSAIARSRIFGMDLPSDNLPWWYALGWVPVIMHPLVFIALVAGLVGAIATRLPQTSFPVRFRINLSLKTWLTLILVGTWMLLVVTKARTYDEERHLSFLYPLLIVLGALGLNFIPARWQLVLTSCIVAASTWSYAAWGKYAYVYKSPLAGSRSATRFMGDYWGLCITKLLPTLPKYIPADTPLEVLVRQAHSVSELQQDRLKHSLLFRQEGYPPYRFVGRTTASDFYAIVLNRQNEDLLAMLEKSSREAGAGPKTRLITSVGMPPHGEPACTLWEVHGIQGW